LKKVCPERPQILVRIHTILKDGKIIPSMGLTTLQIRRTVKPVTGTISKAGPRVYHAQVAIIVAGPAPTRMPLMMILIVANPVMATPQAHGVEIVITAAGPALMAKNMLQILTTVRYVTDKILTEMEIRTEIATHATMTMPWLHGSMGIITLGLLLRFTCLLLMKTKNVPIAMAQTLLEQTALYHVSPATVQSVALTVVIVTPVLPLPILVPPMVAPHTGSIAQAQGIHKETAPTAMIYLLALPMIYCCL